VTRAERELVTALRDELAAIDPARPCDRLAEAAGLGSATVEREASVARLAVRLRRSGEGRGAAPEFAWVSAADHCRAAWLRGRFLARGSLSLAGGRTHLEFVVSPDQAPILALALGEFGLVASWRLRRGRGVVTSKSGEAVGTFLRRVGATGALLEIEARQVSRALRGELNRVLNAESANLQRAVSAGRQLDAIATLEADGRLSTQPRSVRLVADARRATPEASLADLAERLGAHRSAVQRALERLERLASGSDPVPRRNARPGGSRPGRLPRRASHSVGSALA
jgi:WhiA LAGLIDADG-like domain/WhiA C-terminal HTH domain